MVDTQPPNDVRQQSQQLTRFSIDTSQPNVVRHGPSASRTADNCNEQLFNREDVESQSSINDAGAATCSEDGADARLLEQEPPELPHDHGQRQQEEGVCTVDDLVIPQEAAIDHCRKLYRTGFVMLPFLWAANVWMFWPDFRYGHNAEIAKLTRRSACGCAVYLTLFLPWVLAFSIGQDALFGSKLFSRLNIAGIDMADWGLQF